MLNAFLAIWGWRHVSRSVGGAASFVAPGSADRAAHPSSVDSRVPQSPIAPPVRPTALTPSPGVAAESTMSSLDLRRIETMQLKAPAAGLVVVAVLGVLFWCVPAFTLVWEGWSVSSGQFNPGLAEIIGVFIGVIALLLVAGTMIHGAHHMRRLTGLGWCYAAAILALIPWSATSIAGFFVGIWVLNVLNRPEVKEAFVQRSLELEQTGVVGHSR